MQLLFGVQFVWRREELVKLLLCVQEPERTYQTIVSKVDILSNNFIVIRSLLHVCLDCRVG